MNPVEVGIPGMHGKASIIHNFGEINWHRAGAAGPIVGILGIHYQPALGRYNANEKIQRQHFYDLTCAKLESASIE